MSFGCDEFGVHWRPASKGREEAGMPARTAAGPTLLEVNNASLAFQAMGLHAVTLGVDVDGEEE